MTTNALQVFERAIQRCVGLCHIGRTLEHKPVGGLTIPECYRATIVLAVSALDSYVHEVRAELAASIWAGVHSPTPQYHSFPVRLSAAKSGIRSVTGEWLSDEVRLSQQKETFQRPDAVKKALKLVDSRNDLWGRVGIRLACSASSIRHELGMIVDRRNMIAHEADIDPTWGTERSIKGDDAERVVEFIGQIVRAIDDEIS